MKLLRHLTLTFTCAALATFIQRGTTAPGDVDLSFGSEPGLNGLVNRMAVQSDGKFIIAGQFTHVTGLSRTNLARLNADSSGDPTFQAVDIGSFAQIVSLAVQLDGKVLIGGNFTNVNGVGRNGIARLHGNGSVDLDFHPDTGQVSKLLLQPDGKVLVGLSGDGGTNHTVIRLTDDGDIDPSFNAGNSVPGSLLALSSEGKVLILGNVPYNFGIGIHRYTLVRLLGNGSVDPGFASVIDVGGGVGAVAFQTGGKAVITGDFYSINGVPRGHVARLNDDGTLDSTFDPGHTVIRESFDGESAVWSLAVRPNGKVIVGGPIKIKVDEDFIFRRGFLIGLESDGSEDLTFTRTMTSAAVHSVVLQPDGRVLVGGLFKSVNETTRSHLARFHPDGTLDSTLNTESGPNGPVRAVALQPDGKVILGGDFTSASGGTNKNIGRVQPDGSLDTTFNAYLDGSDPEVFALALQADGKVLVGGAFSIPPNGIGATYRDNLTRFNADGSMDYTFTVGTGADDEVRAIAIQPDGKILIGGDFCEVNGTVRCAIARLNPDGGVDPTFDPGRGANDMVLSIALQPDGKILIAGDFDRVNGVTRQFIARLNADGSVDATFGSTLSVDGRIRSIVLQGDGKMLIGGAFTWINGFSRSGIARLHADGSLDESFHPVFETVAGFTSMSSLLVLPDGKAIISGAFTNVNGVPRQGLVRLNSDDSVDTSFDPGHGEVVSCLALQPDGKLLLGGAFTSFNGVPRSYLVRLLGSLPLISVQPTNQLVNAGQSASFSVVAAGGPLTYQWRRDGIGISGATGATLSLGLARNDQAGNYTVVVSGPGGSVTSAPPAVLTANSAPPGCIVAWGENRSGQITVPGEAQSGVTAIAAGYAHTVALKWDGSVVAWGDNDDDQVNVPLNAQSGVRAIAAGNYHTVALKNDGSVVAWGNSGWGQTSVPAGAQSGVMAITAGETHSVALKIDGSVMAWGGNQFGETNVPITAQSGVTAIAAGYGHTVALKNDGSVVAWGWNTNGQSTVPLAAQSGVTAIAAGASHTVALKADGSVLAWGAGTNDTGQFQNYDQSIVPVSAQSGVIAIAAGYNHTVALKNDGSVVAWGWNDRGQTTVPLAAQSGVVTIAAGGKYTLALVPHPVLLKASSSAHGLIVSWPTNAAGFTLQFTTNLSSPVIWQNVSNTPAVSGAHFTVTNSSSGNAQYFRLTKP